MEVPMKRLKLENLEVESFVTDEGQLGRGTVHAHQGSPTFTDCPECGTWECGGDTHQYTCKFYGTCGPSQELINTCAASCKFHYTCDGYPTCNCLEAGA
jgi:hypothetical protein